MGHIFLNTNRNKRSVVLDLKQPAAQAAALKLAERSDVLVYNVRPQAMERLGLGFDAVRAVNPRILYVGGVGFGEGGPYAGKPAYDDLIQGAAGVPSLFMESSADAPRYAPVTLADRSVGLNIAVAVAAGLYYRTQTGHGQRIDVPMFENLVNFVLGDHLAGLTFDPPLGDPGYRRLLAENRRPYATRDGYVCVLIYNDKQWQSFFRIIDRPEMMADPRFANHTNRSAHIREVYAFVADVMRTRTSAEWLEALDRADIPAMPLHTLTSLVDDPHLKATGYFQFIDHPTEGRLRTMMPPSRWSESAPEIRRHAPVLGEHTVEVLREAGYGDTEIAKLLESGAAVTSPAR